MFELHGTRISSTIRKQGRQEEEEVVVTDEPPPTSRKLVYTSKFKIPIYKKRCDHKKCCWID